VVGQPLQHVADIDHQGARRRGDVQPAAVLFLELQTGFLGPQQQGDDIDVLMGAGANPGGLSGYGRIVQQAQDAVAQLDLVLEIVVAEAEVADPVLLAELFGLSDDVFVWLADNVPDDHRADAEAVRDASVKISQVMVEALHGLDDSSDPQVILGAMFGAVARLDAELAGGSLELESSRARLESYVTAACGDSATGLFDVLSGAGALSGV